MEPHDPNPKQNEDPKNGLLLLGLNDIKLLF
jgi:hypothetical protein